MEKFKKFINKTNALAIFSLLATIFGLVLDFVIDIKYWNVMGEIGGLSAIAMGVLALIWIRMKKQKGNILAILGILLGIIAWIGSATL
jgi:hypothetical protein